MDPLALLCNLHADGPATLRRLQRTGVHSLAELFELPIDALSDCLEAEGSVAERFLREAKLLAARAGGGEEGRNRLRADASGEPLSAPAPERPVPSRSVPPAAADPARHDRAPQLRRYVLHPRVRDMRDPLALRLPRVSATHHWLKEGLVDGLDRVLLEDLERAGIRTAEALMRASSLELADELGVPFDRVFHVQRRTAELLGEAAPAAEAAAIEAPRSPEPTPREALAVEPAPREAARAEPANGSASEPKPHPEEDAGGSAGGPFA